MPVITDGPIRCSGDKLDRNSFELPATKVAKQPQAILLIVRVDQQVQVTIHVEVVRV